MLLHKFPKLRSAESQRGVTLLIAVMLVSTLSLIAITVAFLAIQTLRNSRAVTMSEPAIAAAISGSEEGVWNLKRKIGLSGCNGASENLNSNNLWAARSYCLVAQSVTINLVANQDYTFYLYDPIDPNGDIDLLPPKMDPTYDDLTVIPAAAGNVSVTVNRVDGTLVGARSVTSNSSTPTITGLRGFSGADNRMIVTLNSATNIQVVVNTNAGMPTLPTVDSVGCAQKGTPSANSCTGAEAFTRRINVSVPQ